MTNFVSRSLVCIQNAKLCPPKPKLEPAALYVFKKTNCFNLMQV